MRLIILISLAFVSLYANSFQSKVKKCEKIELSRFTALVSCHKIDYLIEYKVEDDDEKDNVKRITAVSTNDKKEIITNVSN